MHIAQKHNAVRYGVSDEHIMLFISHSMLRVCTVFTLDSTKSAASKWMRQSRVLPFSKSGDSNLQL